MENSSDKTRVIVPEEKKFPVMAALISVLIVLLIGLSAAYAYTLRLTRDKQTAVSSQAQPIADQQGSPTGIPIKPGANGLAQETHLLMRGTVEKKTATSLDLLFEVGGITRHTITLTKDAYYGCQERYITDQKGRKVDRAGIWIDTSTMKADAAMLPPPGAKTLEWFNENVRVNDLVEVKNIPAGTDNVKLYSVYIFREGCP